MRDAIARLVLYVKKVLAIECGCGFAMPEPFGVGMEIVKNFRNKAKGIDCRQIIEKDFKNGNDFQQHMASSEKCARLIKNSFDEACKESH